MPVERCVREGRFEVAKTDVAVSELYGQVRKIGAQILN